MKLIDTHSHLYDEAFDADRDEALARAAAEGVGLLHIAKNREGATGCVIFRHNESITRIADYESTANPSTDGEPF